MDREEISIQVFGSHLCKEKDQWRDDANTVMSIHGP
jgi:hypothetical protein